MQNHRLSLALLLLAGAVGCGGGGGGSKTNASVAGVTSNVATVASSQAASVGSGATIAGATSSSTASASSASAIASGPAGTISSAPTTGGGTATPGMQPGSSGSTSTGSSSSGSSTTGSTASSSSSSTSTTPTPTTTPAAKADGAFYPAASLAQARGLATATTLEDGRVLAVGGFLSAAQNKIAFADESEIYDPLANTWTKVSKISGAKDGMMKSSFGLVTVKRAAHTATKLPDGRVLIAGGYGVEKKALFGVGPEIHDVLESAHVFDPRTNKFESTGSMSYPRYGHTATLMSDGRVLIAGGYSPGFFNAHATLAPVEIFDPKSGKFSVPTSYLIFQQTTTEKRQDHAAVALDNGGAVLLIGGQHYDPQWLGIKRVLMLSGTGEVYSAGKFTSVGKLVKPRRYTAASEWNGGAVVMGGDDMKNPIADVEVIDRNTGKFATKTKLTAARTNAAAARTADYALCIGGFAPGGEVADVEAFDGEKMLPGLKLATKRNSASVAVLKDGRVLVIGGFTGGVKDVRSMDGQALSSCELYMK